MSAKVNYVNLREPKKLNIINERLISKSLGGSMTINRMLTSILNPNPLKFQSIQEYGSYEEFSTRNRNKYLAN